MVLSFTLATDPRQRSHSQIRVPQDSLPHFTVSNSILPQPGGPGPRIYIPQEEWRNYNSSHWIPFPSHPTAHRTTVEVFEATSLKELSSLYHFGTDRTENIVPLFLFTGRCLVTAIGYLFVFAVVAWQRVNMPEYNLANFDDDATSKIFQTQHKALRSFYIIPNCII
jgi:hypothetical protein